MLRIIIVSVICPFLLYVLTKEYDEYCKRRKK